MNIKKRILHYLFLCCMYTIVAPAYLHAQSSSSKKKAVIAAACCGLGAFGLYKLTKSHNTPENFTPNKDTLNMLTIAQTCNGNTCTRKMNIDELVTHINHHTMPNKVTLVNEAQTDKIFVAQKGVQINESAKIVFLFSRGYAQTDTVGTNDNFLQTGACAIGAYWYLKDNFIKDAPCITFDYPDRRRLFNFGQETDIACLAYAYEQIRLANPNAHIILLGDCRGAKAALAFAATKPAHLRAILLFSPFLSARQLTDQIAHNRLAWLPGSSTLLHNFFQLYFPNYDGNETSVLTLIENIEHDIPIFIAHRYGDHLVADEHIKNLEQELKRTGHTKVHVAYTHDRSFTHSRLNEVKDIQNGAQKFFSLYDVLAA
jgi:dienelactone hydrolase